MHTQRRRGSSPVLLTRICPRMVITRSKGSPKETPGSYHFQSRTRHVPDSSSVEGGAVDMTVLHETA